ncbi:DUF6675 family protein [Spirochaeta cellobiosiphila]|uniref:DUF6675 family protein n=1 Tax=Spirochaeta cellobiosiphila TaxID=504483 RepID=UPI0012EB217B|nr:DUF6675 family protein [Spirochaeta cellobiosiphila]
MKKYALILILSILSTSLFCQSWSDITKGTSLSNEKKPENIMVWSKDLDSYKKISLIPNSSEKNTIEKAIKNIKPNVISETLIYIPKYSDDNIKLELFNSLRSISKFVDIDYWNWNKQKMRDMFDYSRVISNKNDLTPQNDPLEVNVKNDKIYVDQEMEPFSRFVSEYKYQSKANIFTFTGTNITPIKYDWFTAVKPGNMLTYFQIYYGSDFTVIYGVGGVDVFDGFGTLKNKISDPFYYRTNGLFEWYLEEHIKPIFAMEQDNE